LIGTTLIGLLDSVFHYIFESQVEQLGVESRIDHISTGVGACIDFLAGEKLPGIEALKESAVRYRVK
jgi:hypothetical protein